MRLLLLIYHRIFFWCYSFYFLKYRGKVVTVVESALNSNIGNTHIGREKQLFSRRNPCQVDVIA